MTFVGIRYEAKIHFASYELGDDVTSTTKSHHIQEYCDANSRSVAGNTIIFC